MMQRLTGIGKTEEAIINALRGQCGLSDRELTDFIKGSFDNVNEINHSCRFLEKQGILVRKKREDGRIGNWLTGAKPPVLPLPWVDEGGFGDDLPEKRMKQILESFLISRGWSPEIRWSPNSGIDIEASQDTRKWIIQVKGIRPPVLAPNDTFTTVIGEILQRMDESSRKYSVALPGTEPFIRLWKRLPSIAKARTGITALFVNPSGSVSEKAD